MDISAYKDALLKKRAELVAVIAGSSPSRARWSTITAARATWPTRRPAITRCTFSCKLKQTDAKILQAIDEALLRIDKGALACAATAASRLPRRGSNAIPWTRVCITCKEKQKS